MMARHKIWASVLLVGATALVLVLASVLVRPQSAAGGDDRVVAVLADPGAAQPPGLRDAVRAARADPGNPALAQAAARALIAAGRAAGDARLVGAALAVLRPAMAAPEAETLILAATARQYQHDFAGARALLDQTLALAPRSQTARLMRATLATVQGRLRDAGADCQALADARVAALCQATAGLLTNRAPQIEGRLQVWTADPAILGPELLPWAMGLRGELAAQRGDLALARAQFAAVLAQTPGALRERLLLADVLLASGAAAAVPDLLRPAPGTDAVLLRRALAARALGDAAADDVAELARRIRLNRDIGLDAHAREEAAFFLHLAPDPAQALARAQANWALQHEREDAELLLAAAIAAGQPQAAAPVLAWMAAEGVTAIALPAALAQGPR